jgi:bifunctional DNA-binding transcriptional regulator/antitoxin component of YhaV-PrlF toxin-antitoxin module
MACGGYMMAAHDIVPIMPSPRDVTVVTERGQVSIPARLRKELALHQGLRLAWTRVGEREMRVTILGEPAPPGAEAMRGFARRFRAKPKRTADWMRELREGED